MSSGKRKAQDKSPVKDVIATAIAAYVVKVMVIIVASLKQVDRKCSTRHKKKLLILFCTLLGSYYIYLAVKVLHGTPEKQLPVPQTLLPLDSTIIKRQMNIKK